MQDCALHAGVALSILQSQFLWMVLKIHCLEFTGQSSFNNMGCSPFERTQAACTCSSVSRIGLVTITCVAACLQVYDEVGYCSLSSWTGGWIVWEGQFDASVGIGAALLCCILAGGGCATAGLWTTCSGSVLLVFRMLGVTPPESKLRSCQDVSFSFFILHY